MRFRSSLVTLLVLSGMTFSLRAQTAVAKLPANSTVYIASMDDGFDTFLRDALTKKNVPLKIVTDRNEAQYEITGHSDSQKASTAKKVIRLDWHSNEQASIQIADIKSGTVVFAYSVNKQSSAHGKKSTAEACAKHIKDQIEAK